MPARKKSIEEKKTTGTYRKDRDGSVCDVPTVGTVSKPAGLSELESTVWDTAVKDAPAGLLGAIDAGILHTWVSAYAVAQLASQDLAGRGITIVNRSGNEQQNPSVNLWHKAVSTMQKASSALGFDPSSRSRIKIETPRPETREERAWRELKDK